MFKRVFFLIFLSLYLKTSLASIPPGYYNNASGLSGYNLKTALYHIINDHTVITYSGLWQAFLITDNKPNGTVWDIYSDIPDGSANGNPPYIYYFVTNQCSATPGYENSCYNREHSFPTSWSGAGTTDTVYTDLFHIYPVDSYVNERRSNYPYGTVGVVNWTSLNGGKLGSCNFNGYTGVVFEPRDEYKGDIARSYFYMATRYENLIASWETINSIGNAVLNGTKFPCFESWFLNLLLSWHYADPVSQKEIDRNDDIYNSYQHNRNPFIDHPEYVAAIWDPGAGILPEPSNHALDFSRHNLKVHWNGATGNVLPQGYLIRMSTVSYQAIALPVDGVPVSNSLYDKNVPFGVNEVIFSNLLPGTNYYFKIFPYSGSGAAINYKTDGLIPKIQQSTLP